MSILKIDFFPELLDLFGLELLGSVTAIKHRSVPVYLLVFEPVLEQREILPLDLQDACVDQPLDEFLILVAQVAFGDNFFRSYI